MRTVAHTLPPTPASIPEPENEYMAFYITKQLNEDLEKVNSLKKKMSQILALQAM